MHIVRFAETVDAFVGDLMPHRLCDYLYELCNIYTEYYDKCYCVERDGKTKVERRRKRRAGHTWRGCRCRGGFFGSPRPTFPCRAALPGGAEDSRRQAAADARGRRRH